MTKPLHVRITEPSLWWDLRYSLALGDCSAVRLPDGTVAVTHHNASDDREAWLELTFFMRAWQLKHPNVLVELVR